MPTYTLGLQQRIFMYDSYVITSSCREVVRRFQANYPGMRVPSREAISKAELMRVNANFLRRCHRCIDAEGQHLQHLL